MPSAMKIPGLTDYQTRLAEEMGMLRIEDARYAATPMTTTQMTDASGVGMSVEIPDRFIDLVVDESVLLKAVRVYRTSKPSGDLAKLDITGYVTESATENTTSTETRAPTPNSVHYQNMKLRSQFDFTGELEEDNIEGAGGINTYLACLTKAIANDTETLSIEGDDSDGGSTDRSRLIRANDGWHIQTGAGSGAHIQNAGGKRPSWALLNAMIMSLPTRYRGGNWKQKFKWLMSPNCAQLFATEAVSRATGLGDGTYKGDALAPHGIAIMEVPRIPENLTVSGTASLGTFIWLVVPTNFVYTIQRQLTIASWRNVRKDATEITAFSRNDFVIENIDAVAKAINVNLDQAATIYA